MPPPKLKLAEELGLLEGVVVITSVVFGIGIFISPREVLMHAGSVWGSLIIWVVCGVITVAGAMCYAELGTMLPRSGGEYHYLNEAYGGLIGFLYLWDSLLIVVPSINAIMALTFASTILYSAFPNCPVIDPLCKKLLAAVTICVLTYINAYNVRYTARLQNIFLCVLCFIIICVILAGIAHIAQGNIDHFRNGWEGTSTSVSQWAVAYFAGVFSYSGWNFLNFMIEELQDPYRNLPRAIFITLPILTGVFITVNICFFAVLGTEVIRETESIILEYTETTLRFLFWITPFLVSVAILGSLSVHIMGSARICFAGARNGHLPQLLAHINVKCLSPMPALIFMMMISLLMLIPDSLTLLIIYSTVVERVFNIMCCSIIVYFRYKKPSIPRPLKVNLFWPLLFVLSNSSILLIPVISQPIAVALGVVVTLLGVPVYYLLVKKKFRCIAFISEKILTFNQKLLLTAIED